MAQSFLDELRWRGMLSQTAGEGIEAHLAGGCRTAYCGFDPTADSLTLGNYVALKLLAHWQRAGHRPIVVVGGGTGLIGDPSGKSAERQLLDPEQVKANIAGQRRIFERMLDFTGPNAAIVVDNGEWLGRLGYIEVLRDVGKHFSVNQMIVRDSVASRLNSREQGISYTEFSYMLLQANDFRHLCEHEGVEMQMGGSDQWGNITAGTDLIRRRLARTAYGLTWPLLTRSDGQKMGKSVHGALWLDPNKTSPYQFRQYWIQLPDEDVERFLLQLTLRPVDEIRALVAEHAADPGRRIAQRALAHDVTALVHGEAAEAAAAEAAGVLFGGDPTVASADALGVVAREVPATVMSRSGLDDLVAILQRAGLASSNGDARRGLQQKAFRANGRVLEAENSLSEVGLLHGRYILLRKGKTNFHLLDVTD